jgi:hypothetical protein
VEAHGLIPTSYWAIGLHVRAVGACGGGLSLLYRALDAMESMGRGAYHSLVNVHLGEICMLADQFEEALICAERALRLTRGRGERGYEAATLCLLGEITSHRNPLDTGTAAGRYHGALAVADDLTMRPLVARCHLNFGALHQRTGKPRGAREQLTGAMTMFREMHMPFRLEKAKAEMRADGIRCHRDAKITSLVARPSWKSKLALSRTIASLPLVRRSARRGRNLSITAVA